MGFPPPGTVWVYAGLTHTWLADSRLHDAELLHVGPDVEDEPEAVQEPFQMPLMVLPVSALAHLKRPKIRGHAAVPGSGPAGETCGTCAHAVVREMSKNYWKCGLSKARWTGGAGTDVRKRDPACEKWAVKS
jgi:ribosomal protein L37AE/L43A